MKTAEGVYNKFFCFYEKAVIPNWKFGRLEIRNDKFDPLCIFTAKESFSQSFYAVGKY